MAEYDFVALQKKLKKELDSARFQHTLGVMYTSAALAMAHDGDLMKAQVAGLLHDCAKCIPSKKKLKLCEQKHLDVSDYEKNNPFMLHARLGAVLARDMYGVHDPDVLSAIEWHTTGKPEMTKLEKIIFIADYMEPGRCKASDLPEVRRLAFRDLDRCMYVICRDTLVYLEESGAQIDPMTQRACDYYKSLYDEEKKTGGNSDAESK